MSQSHDAATVNVFALAPRVGYALSLADIVTFWPRMGVTYYTSTSESTSTSVPPTTTKNTTNGFGFDIEVARGGSAFGSFR